MAGRTGLGVDSQGGPIVDPTKNVLDLVSAAVLRLDDLRAAETRRQDDLREQTARHVAEIARLTAEFQEKLRDAEAKRIDAIRAVDVNAVSVASGRTADQAAVLASQVQVSADALRSLVATSAATLAAQHASYNAEITKRLSELERSKYEGAGRSTVFDPQLAGMLTEMKGLLESRATSTGKSAGLSLGWALLLGALTLIGMVLGLVGYLK